MLADHFKLWDPDARNGHSPHVAPLKLHPYSGKLGKPYQSESQKATSSLNPGIMSSSNVFLKTQEINVKQQSEGGLLP